MDENKKAARAEIRAKKQELKALVERLRSALNTKVTLVGSAEKGRITIEYTSYEDLARLEELIGRGEF